MTATDLRDLTWVSRLDNGYLGCRAMRHGWELSRFRLKDPDDRTRVPGQWQQVIVRSLRCFRCDTVRIDYYGRNAGEFMRVKSRYLYPDGYRWETDSERLRPVNSDFLWEQYRRSGE